ncbi:unnamed protein product [Cylindrotheca closterium]|uniref:Adenosine deaminase n=1 Tax=Cylindrotheca closterium TaxID=2856 RepID=A0AAD2G1F1_9STRA|nr:unnamed protein product [Cylindrotheca closterium]
MMMEEAIEKLPKVELHAHLNGCIRESTLFDLAKERSVTLSHEHFHHQDHQVPSNSSILDHDDPPAARFFNVRPRSLQDCFDIFAEIPKCVDDLISLRRITLEALEDFAKHNVVYLELRSTPKQLHVQSANKTGNYGAEQKKPRLASKKDYCHVILQAMEDFEKDQNQLNLKQEEQRKIANESNAPSSQQGPIPTMTCRFLVAVDRSHSNETAMEHIELAKDLVQSDEYGYRVVGVDIGGNPTKNHFHDFRPAFEVAREAGLKITLHCAEVPCHDNDDDPSNKRVVIAYDEAKSILEFAPDRLGHALLLPPSLQSMLQKSKIPVECCPTSNVMTLELAKDFHGSLLDGMKQHPQLPLWLESNHPVSINTDDPGVFDTDPTKEWRLVQETYGLSLERIQQVLLESMDQAFCDTATKDRIKTQMKLAFDS